jgi:outer membrane lipoprotein carrier protein
MNALLRVLCVVCASLPWFSAQASTGSSAALQRFVAQVQTLSAQFEQVQTDEDGEVLARRSGTVELSRPGRFRWEYSQPYAQLMVCDGSKVYNYEPDLAQVTVRAADEILRGTPAALLAQAGTDLGDGFRIEDGGRQGKTDLVRLKPKADEGDFRAIEMWLVDGVPQRMRFLDTLGGATDIRFSAVRTGIKLDATRFRFVAPKGVDVIDAGAP